MNVVFLDSNELHEIEYNSGNLYWRLSVIY